VNNVRENIDRIGSNDQDTIETLGHEFSDTGTYDDDIAGKHVEAGALKLTWCADGNDSDGACSSVLIGSREDSYWRAEWNGMLKVQRFALDMIFRVSNQDDLANESSMQDGKGAGGSDVTTTDDGNAGMLRRHDKPLFRFLES
jgi:hypothetical protein